MPSKTAGFTVNDVMSRIIPGAFFSFFLLLIFIGVDSSLDRLPNPELSIVYLVLVGAGVFIIGEIIHNFRRSVIRVPPIFKRYVYYETKNTTHLGPIQKTCQMRFSTIPVLRNIGYPIRSIYKNHPNRNFIEELVSKEYGFKPDDLSSADIYILLLSAIGDDISNRTRNYQRLEEMKGNLLFGYMLIVPLYILSAIYFNSISYLESFAVIILSGILVFSMVSIPIITSTQTEYIDSLIIDYFVKMS